eukprot:1766101-Amphidinium_carterae.1
MLGFQVRMLGAPFPRAGLSDNLLKELRLCSYQNLVMHAPFLREQPKEVIALIVQPLANKLNNREFTDHTVETTTITSNLPVTVPT